METIKGYKGFNKNLKCRDKQYEIGKTYTEEEAKLCTTGMHFCENPVDVLNYYSAGDGNRFCEVEAVDASEEREDDSKRVTKTLSIKAEISVFSICRIAVSAFFENFGFVKKISESKTANAGDNGAANAGDNGAANAGDYGAANAGHHGAANAGDHGAANAGDYGAANAGHHGAANAGHHGAANAGDYGAANAGHYGAANAGDCGAAHAGYCGAANAGYCGAANAGDHGAANAGDYGAANAGHYGAANAGHHGAANAGDHGAANAGYCGAALVTNEGKVKGGIGCILVARDIERKDGTYVVTDWACAIVDGEKIKADTWYHLINGKLEELCEEEVNEGKS